MQKVIFTGPESSGKTTMSKWYAEQIGGMYVPEFARIYFQAGNENYGLKDLEEIGRGQLALLESADQFERQAVCDTGMLVVKIWAELKFGVQLEFVNNSIVKDNLALYILCKPDIPWEPDPLREDEHSRNELFEHYKMLLNKYQLRYQVLEGSLEERKKFLLGLNLPD